MKSFPVSLASSVEMASIGNQSFSIAFQIPLVIRRSLEYDISVIISSFE